MVDRNWLGFSVGIEINFFVLEVEIDFVFVCMPVVKFACMDRTSLGFVAGIATDLFLFVRVENDLLSMWRSTDLVFVCEVEANFVFVCGPKITWF